MEEATATTRTRVYFNDDEREELKRAYDGGMDSTRQDKVSLIQQVVKKLRREGSEIKVSTLY